ncbi:MAG: hypothetical protein M1834_005359 [Cirrosporium novae-zelandiae]|nr:MAG: hypothetical protein M1834_005359 [Cirrosporium novae-zelandiae]
MSIPRNSSNPGPSTQEPWHRNDPFIRTYWTEELFEKYGTLGPDNFERTYLTNPIHPVFQPLESKPWAVNGTRLASRLLTLPQLMCFWWMIFEPSPLKLNQLSRQLGCNILLLNLPTFPLSESQCETLDYKMQLAGTAVVWSDRTIDQAWGRTTRLNDQAPKPLAGTKSVIEVHSVFRDLDPDNKNMKEWQKICAEFIFAMTLVHEFVHAAWLATWPCPEQLGYPPGTPEPDPYFVSYSRSELGHSWEQETFHNKFMTGAEFVDFKLGLMVVKWPDGVSDVLGGVKVDLKIKKWNTYYLVPFKWTASLFEDRFWTTTVRKYGVSALRPKKRIGRRIYNSEWIMLHQRPDGTVPSSSSQDGLSPNDSSRDKPVDADLFVRLASPPASSTESSTESSLESEDLLLSYNPENDVGWGGLGGMQP